MTLSLGCHLKGGLKKYLQGIAGKHNLGTNNYYKCKSYHSCRSHWSGHMSIKFTEAEI